MYNKYLAELSKEQLLELIELYAKNWLAHDGVWFQSIERKFGMAEAMYHDEEAWKRFTVIEAKRIKEFLQLPENPGLEGLEQALEQEEAGAGQSARPVTDCSDDEGEDSEGAEDAEGRQAAVVS